MLFCVLAVPSTMLNKTDSYFSLYLELFPHNLGIIDIFIES